MFDRFTKPSRAAMTGSRDLCLEYGHEVIDADHVLLALCGLAREGETRAGMLLERIGVTPDEVAAAVEARIERGEPHRERPKRLLFSEPAKRTLEAAFEAASRNGDHVIGTEHLLVGLASVAGSEAEVALRSVGATRERFDAALPELPEGTE
ncbi:MAG: Clp protease N-terminal domain-containing protein [Planctomycetota bacterium JB042]